MQAEDDPPDAPGWYFEQVGKISHKERELPWLVGDFNLYSGLAAALIAGVAIDHADRDPSVGGLGGVIGTEGDFVKLGDDIYTAIPGTGYLTSLLAKDYRGFVYMGIHNAVSSAVMSSLKTGVGQRRPGDQSNTTFPSGHTNTAFLGAAFMQQRYGSKWGIPSYVSAVIVAWSRVHGNKHFVNDTVAGASIAMMSSWALVPPYDRERRDHWLDMERERPLSYEFEMTLNDIDRNTIQAPRGSGDRFAMPYDRQTNEPWANSHIEVEYRANDRQAWSARFSPWEVRSFGQFSQPTTFAGQTFQANQQLRLAHFLWAYGAQYRHTLVKNERLRFRLGAGLTGQEAEVDIFVVDDTQPEKRGQTAKASADLFYAVAHADVEFRLGGKFLVTGELDYGYSGNGDFSDLSAALTWRINPKWDASVGWRNYTSKIDKDGLFNDFERSGPAFNFVYSF